MKYAKFYKIILLTHWRDQYRENECETQTKHWQHQCRESEHTNKNEKHNILIKMEKPTHLPYKYIFKKPNYEMSGI